MLDPYRQEHSPAPSGQIVVGERVIYVVLRCEYDGSSEPQMLAAYDGEDARHSANALKALLELAYAPGRVMVLPVPVWPLLTTKSAS